MFVPDPICQPLKETARVRQKNTVGLFPRTLLHWVVGNVLDVDNINISHSRSLCISNNNSIVNSWVLKEENHIQYSKIFIQVILTEQEKHFDLKQL